MNLKPVYVISQRNNYKPDAVCSTLEKVLDYLRWRSGKMGERAELKQHNVSFWTFSVEGMQDWFIHAYVVDERGEFGEWKE